MSSDDRKRTYTRDMLVASAMIVAGLALCGLSLAEPKAHPQQFAQATPPLQARVSMVACHPKQDIVAAGYSDGTVLMVRLSDGAEILVRRNGTVAVSALAWNGRGTVLAFSDENGDAGLLDL